MKRIARRYKTQYDELKKSTGDKSQQAETPECETTTTETTTTAAKAAAPATEAPPTETASVEVSAYENKIKELTEKVQSLEAEVKKFQNANEQKEVSVLLSCLWCLFEQPAR